MSKTILEKNVPLSQSKLWKWQKKSFQTHGQGLWQRGLPFWSTSNARLAESYARMICALIQDWELNFPEQKSLPWSILELGSGTGQFTFLLLNAIDKFTKANNLTNKIHYLQSDCVSANRDAWKSHPQFQPWINNGTLHCILVDAEPGPTSDTEWMDIRKQQAITTPLILIGNYFFDTIPQGAWKITEEGNVEIGLATLEIDSEHVENKQPRNYDVSKIQTDINFAPTSGQRYHTDATIQNFIEKLLRQPPGDHYIPEASIQFLQRIHKLCEGKMFLLASDKFSEPLQPIRIKSRMTPHAETFSLIVDPGALVVELEPGFNKHWFPPEWTAMRSIAKLACPINIPTPKIDRETERGMWTDCAAQGLFHYRRLRAKEFSSTEDMLDAIDELRSDPSSINFTYNELRKLRYKNSRHRSRARMLIKAAVKNVYAFPGNRFIITKIAQTLETWQEFEDAAYLYSILCFIDPNNPEHPPKHESCTQKIAQQKQQANKNNDAIRYTTMAVWIIVALSLAALVVWTSTRMFPT